MKFANAASAVLLAVGCAHASTNDHTHHHKHAGHTSAPIGVMGDHVHQKGEVMVSYRYMRMSMKGNQDGTSDRSPEEIVSTASNPFANPPMMPPTLRVVPTEMTMDMHMVGLMYAPTDRITLMGMLNYVTKEMDHITFAGPMGTTRLGGFTTRTSGMGDTSLSALIRLGADHHSRWHATLGLSLPTGGTDETDDILTPMNTRPSPRLPYPMQLGSGSYDAITGLTFRESSGAWQFGAQWRSVLRLRENSDDYRLGNEHLLQGWLGYQINDAVQLSARMAYLDRGNIRGRDPRIAAPVQTADPDRQGFERLDFAGGVRVQLPGGRHRLGLELAVPIHQDLDGPQMETDWSLNAGWQVLF